MLALPVTYSQRDLRWASKRLGTSSSTIGGYGCLLTCMATLAKYYGKDTDPDRLNQSLIAIEGFTNGNLYEWYTGVPKIYPDIICTKLKQTPFNLDSRHFTEIDEQLKKGYPVVIEVDFYPDPAVQMHFVVIIDGSGGEYTVYDPYYGDLSSLRRYGEPKVTIQGYYFHEGPIQPTDIISIELSGDTRKGWENLIAYREVRELGPEGSFEGYINALIGSDRALPTIKKDKENADKKITSLTETINNTNKLCDGYKIAIAEWELFRDKLWTSLNPIGKEKNTANILSEVQEMITKEDQDRIIAKSEEKYRTGYTRMLDTLRGYTSMPDATEESVLEAVLAALNELSGLKAGQTTNPVEESPKKAPNILTRFFMKLFKRKG